MRRLGFWFAGGTLAIPWMAFVHGSAAAREEPTPAASAASAPPASSAAPATSAATTPSAAPSSDAPAGERRVLTLSEAEQIALQQQPQVLIAKAATGIAEAEAEQARSPLLPQITASASYMGKTNNIVPGTSAVSQPWPTSKAFSAFNFGVSGTQLIYDFGQTNGKYRAAASTADAQRVAEQTARLQVLFGARRAFFNARATLELVDVARETLDDQNRHLTQVQGFVGVGTQPPIALAQQRAAVANALVALISAQNNYETAKAQLNQAIGVAGGTEYDVADVDLGPVEGEDDALAALVAKALTGRPELATLEKELEAQEETLSSARGGYGPAFSAAAGASEAGPGLDNMIYNWNLGVQLIWPIFQGGLTNGQVHQAEAGLQSLVAQRAQEILAVRLDVDSARLAIRAAKATMGASEDAVTSAREQLRLAEQRYATGVGSIIELNDAQVSYTSAAAQVVQAHYGLASARAQLLAALGRT